MEINNIINIISAKNYLIIFIITYFVAPGPVSPAEPGRDRLPLQRRLSQTYIITFITKNDAIAVLAAISVILKYIKILSRLSV